MHGLTKEAKGHYSKKEKQLTIVALFCNTHNSVKEITKAHMLWSHLFMIWDEIDEEQYNTEWNALICECNYYTIIHARNYLLMS